MSSAIRLTNTLTRQLEPFEPMVPGRVGVYLCGPTVYDLAHLGNARSAVNFDMLHRLLRHDFGVANVAFVRNITDVDDKIIARALETGVSIADLTAGSTQDYLDDLEALCVLPVTNQPRATEYIGEMIAMIQTLIDKGHAYAAEGHVLFAVDSWKDRYGALSGRSVEDMIAGARVEVAPYKRNPMDFVLWKPSSDDLPGWDSPWGRGRPGWHIECSAMAYELLGDSFDIHGGGNDLMFPHHENEIAQSCCAHPEGDFARFWLHNEMLQVEGKKMSKSLGNFFTVRDLLDQGVPGEVIRFVFLSTHYRKPMDWTEKKAREAEATLRKWYAQVEQGPVSAVVHAPVIEALADDLNTAGALSELHQLSQADDVATLRATLGFLGLMGDAVPDWAEKPDIDLSGYADWFAGLREQAKAKKDFSEVDRAKAALVAAGVEVRMSKEGVELLPAAGFDASKLEALK